MLRSLGGLENLAADMNYRNSSDVNVTVQGSAGIDYKKLGSCVADALIRARVGFKCDERVFARLIKDLIDYV